MPRRRGAVCLEGPSKGVRGRQAGWFRCTAASRSAYASASAQKGALTPSKDTRYTKSCGAAARPQGMSWTGEEGVSASGGGLRRTRRGLRCEGAGGIIHRAGARTRGQERPQRKRRSISEAQLAGDGAASIAATGVVEGRRRGALAWLDGSWRPREEPSPVVPSRSLPWCNTDACTFASGPRCRRVCVRGLPHLGQRRAAPGRAVTLPAPRRHPRQRCPASILGLQKKCLHGTEAPWTSAVRDPCLVGTTAEVH
jgi:hypothetical protein